MSSGLIAKGAVYLPLPLTFCSVYLASCSKASQTSHRSNSFSASLWDAGDQLHLGQESENSLQIFSVAANAHTSSMWELHQEQHSKALHFTLAIPLYNKYL